MSMSMSMGMIVSLVSSLLRKTRTVAYDGKDEDHPLQLSATPGLMTLLDLSLHRSVEGQLTATICAGNALLQTWLDLKHQAQLVYWQQPDDATTSTTTTTTTTSSSTTTSLARACLESALDAIEKLTTDKLASSANLTDAYETSSSTGGGGGGGSLLLLSGILQPNQLQEAIADGKKDSGRRHLPLLQRSRDCWETSRLICIDHVWADEVHVVCQKHVRHLAKHPHCNYQHFNGDTNNGRAAHWYDAKVLVDLVLNDLPTRIHQFKLALEANGVVTKRLYLVKCEYRAPFRAFLEAHQSVQRAPSIAMVNAYYHNNTQQQQQQQQSSSKTFQQEEESLESLLATPALIEALALEKECECMEVRMAQALLPFCELARILDHKRAKFKPGTLEKDELLALQTLLQRLKCMLCRKVGPETSTGIRPLLLDLQGVARDEDYPSSSFTTTPTSNSENAFLGRLHVFTSQLELLSTLIAIKNIKTSTRSSSSSSSGGGGSFVFVVEGKRGGSATDGSSHAIPPSIIKECSAFDSEMFEAQCQDWYAMVQRQHELVSSFADLAERIRKAEMIKGISSCATSEASLSVVRQRLLQIMADRDKRFEVLREVVEEVCKREMNWHVQLIQPSDDTVLQLPNPTSVVGVFGPCLQMAGEPLPIG